MDRGIGETQTSKAIESSKFNPSPSIGSAFAQIKGDKMIKSGIFDKNGKEVKIGDTLILPYVDPMGGLYEDTSNNEVTVLFKHGCFGYETVIDFIPLMNWSKKKTGEYVCNRGNKIIILDKYVFQIKGK